MPDVRETTLDANSEGKTVAAVVRVLLEIPWTKAKDLCRSGRVVVDGQPELDPAARVSAGARLVVSPSAPRLRARGLDRDAIVDHDRDVVVVHKPAGIVSVPFDPGERDTLIDLVRVTLRKLEGGRGSPDLRVVQRLDKDTSGLLVFARNRTAERALQKQLRAHSVERRYLAIAHGGVKTGTHETMLIVDRGDGLRGSWGRSPRQRGPAPEGAKRAMTRVEPKRPLRGATLVACTLETGRQHQIRIHLAESGHPVVGETVYIRDYTGPVLEAPRCMLHAEVLGFVHPRTGKRVRFEADPPSDFVTVLDKLSG